ncbi:MAG TPA: TAXI family TRAP transporter solute-binding subunit [Candidatus Eisenbacteria bacterium]|nr:TAXI family TRAP transporter solute-binding subunit [Candidatus Eisenbacteria bacterium]
MRRRFSIAFAEFIKVWGLVVLIVAAGFAVTYQYIGAPPPKAIRIATGASDGAYYAFAQRYARLLANDGIFLEVVSTAGSVENLQLLKKGEVSLALVQGGSATNEDKEQLQSLGSLFFEPVWIFTPKQSAIKRFSHLKGKRVAVGSAGSGTHLLATQLLSAAGITEFNTTLIPKGSAEAIDLLSRGGIDAAFFVASAEAPFIRRLSKEPAVELLNFDRAPAFSHLFPFLTPVTLNEGVLNLEHNVPARDTTLVAVSASLAARADLNASLIPALLNAATRVHQAGGILERKRQFPSIDSVDLPLNEDARRYITHGPTFLYRWLPYGTAVLLDRLKILLLPFLALIPLFRVAPPLYNWRIRSKIYRWYRAVREIDAMFHNETAAGSSQSIMERLTKLEREVASVAVPLSYNGELYHLRLHIGFLQEKLEKLSGQSSTDAGRRLDASRPG